MSHAEPELAVTAPTAGDRDPVDALAEDFADRFRRGEYPSVGDFAAAHPEYAEQLRELLPAVAQMELLKRFRRAGGGGTPDAPPDRFGDFHIIRELGRGGMGIVFEAVQESLGRSVALKVLSSHAPPSGNRRERFVREAHAAARLHHTNIVPVFGVGEQHGVPYYVMQLIRGDGLHEVVRRWRARRRNQRPAAASAVTGAVTAGGLTGEDPVTLAETVPESQEVGPAYGDWSFVAEVGLQVADALHYAHKQGVLHRDVKPANLLLDPAGRVWVTDFGLAKLVDVDGLTATGDILGTLQYLAPECLSGKADPRSDVYGLGATLYELLTLEPPYPSDSPARLVRQLADRDPPRPRHINPDIPRDLETIVLKAMAREPARRYADALELARDLQAFLEDRPIRARRQSVVGRAWRWCRRNPAVAVLSVNMVAALGFAGAVGWVSYARTRAALEAEAQQLRAAESAKDESERARSRAEQVSRQLNANLQLSLEAFEAVFDAAGGGPALGARGFNWPGPGLGFPGHPFGATGFLGGPAWNSAEERAAVLEAVLNFYDRFAEQNSNANGVFPHLQFEAGRAYRRVGEMHLMRGNLDKAAVAFRRAAALLEEFIRSNPGDAPARTELVLTYLNAPPEVFPDSEQVLVRAHQLAQTPEGRAEPWLTLAGAVSLRLAELQLRAGNYPQAEATYRRAIAELAIARNGPENRSGTVLGESALARVQLAWLLTETERPAEARKLVDQAVAELRNPGERPGRLGRAGWESSVAVNLLAAEVYDRLGDRTAAEAARAAAKQSFGNPNGGGGRFDLTPPGFKKDGPPRKK
jgi:serine/threonine protein kinase